MLKGIICGATAVGKSDLALQLAKRNGFSILSADSRQMYAALSIGVNAPNEEEKKSVPHHLVSCLPLERAFSPREFALTAEQILQDNPDTPFLVVGGTGLYLKEWLYPAQQTRGETPLEIKAEVEKRIENQGLTALHAEISKLDPGPASKVHPHDGFRIRKLWENYLITGKSYADFASQSEIKTEYASIPFYWIDEEREALYDRIDQRVTDMLQRGWLEEVKKLTEQNLDWSYPGLNSIGYQELAQVVSGKMSLPNAIRDIQQQTRKYAKRQITYFKNQFPTVLQLMRKDAYAKLEDSMGLWEAFCHTF